MDEPRIILSPESAGGDPDMPWTNFPVVYQSTITDGDDDTIRLDVDEVGQGRLTFDQSGSVTVLFLDQAQLYDLAYLIERGRSAVSSHQREGWAA